MTVDRSAAARADLSQEMGKWRKQLQQGEVPILGGVALPRLRGSQVLVLGLQRRPVAGVTAQLNAG